LQTPLSTASSVLAARTTDVSYVCKTSTCRGSHSSSVAVAASAGRVIGCIVGDGADQLQLTATCIVPNQHRRIDSKTTRLTPYLAMHSRCQCVDRAGVSTALTAIPLDARSRNRLGTNKLCCQWCCLSQISSHLHFAGCPSWLGIRLLQSNLLSAWE